jgi:hypothetical protein
MLKDIALDVAKNIAGLGLFEEILVEQEATSTKFTAYPEDSLLTVLANSKAKVAELPDACGMLNLGFYVGLTNLYKDPDPAKKSTVGVSNNAKGEVDRLTFNNVDGNNDEYRLTPTNLMKTKSRTFKGTTWEVVVSPQANKISELSQRGTLYSSIDPNLTASTENGKLVFTFGGSAGGGHAGKFVFADTTQTLKRPVSLSIQALLTAFKMCSQGTPVLSISERATKVEFDSGLIAYEYITPTQK